MPSTQSGRRWRSTMPNATGMMVIANTRATTPGMLASPRSPAPKWDVDSARKSGTVTADATLLIPVIVTDSAVSPRARCVSMLAIIPPGEAPSSTSPTASSGSSENSSAIANASSGDSSDRLSIPIATPRGATSTRLKSAGVSARPRLHMIAAIASGSSTSARSGESILDRT